ncbi:hypothetical protein BGZ49_010516 [Haplosporangium sp. Z 27]|nr:hypothetical protein BGZ49_010516 [Haplosporangium sp. Z 27]
MTSAIKALSALKHSAEARRLLKKAPKMLEQAELSALDNILAMLEYAKTFTEAASSDTSPFISQLYPTIWELKDKVTPANVSIHNSAANDLDTDVPAANGSDTNAPTPDLVDEFKKIFHGEISRRWSVDDIPRSVLIATYLNPAVTFHRFFSNETERDNEKIGLRTYTRRAIIGISMVLCHQNQGSIEEKKRKIISQLEDYEDEVSNISYEEFRANPHTWWRNRHTFYPYLGHIARAYFSIQATSSSSERLFSSAGNILTKSRSGLSNFHVSRLLLIKSAKSFMIDEDEDGPEERFDFKYKSDEEDWEDDDCEYIEQDEQAYDFDLEE